MADKIRKYSRKREAIREKLMGTKTHPNAEWIYSGLKEEIPDLSLATVYRNLNEMRQNGEVQLVTYWGGKERFDGNVQKHTHFVCDECGKIEDLDFMEQDSEIDRAAQEKFDGKVDYHDLIFHGLCSECKKKMS